MRSRPIALWSLAAFGLQAPFLWSVAHAQQNAGNRPTDEEVVVTGTRVADRSRLDTLAPVDVLPAEQLTQQATTELAEALSTAAPSLTFPRPSITDGTDHIRPATLRGLAPDQTLVLVNSKRRHQSALVNVNGSIGRGSAAVDLNAIPLAAIERVEVLREGASAQYGSDAIAGVVNIRLREASEGGAASITYGTYDTDVETARGSRSESDGNTFTASAWSGLGLGEEGFLTLSAEYRDRDPTSRGDLDTRVTPARVTSRYGDSRIEDLTFYLNTGVPMSDTWDIYAWAGYQQRDGESAAFFRLADNNNNVPSIHPGGFLPLITSDVEDLALAWGTRFELGDWDADASVVYGRNELQYGVRNSVNATLGAASPTSFDAGTLEYDQIVFNFGLVSQLELGSLPVNTAVGLEARQENYAIDAGEPASYIRGPITVGQLGSLAAPGAQGFPGFQPSNTVDEDRTAYGVYVDLESQVTDAFLASVAARAEDYSDFGSALTGKVSARYDFSPAFALRSTVSTGFRAPGLQQAYFTSTATNFINGVPFEVGTFPATSAIARTLGARELDAEESVNYSLGAVLRIADFEATIDAYRIDVDDRIVLSENLNAPTPRADLTALLTPFNVGAARFFINGVDTKTEGVDIVLRQRLDAADVGRFVFTASANFNETEVTRLPTTNVLSSLSPPPVLFGRINVLTFEQGTPEQKLNLSADWTTDVGFGEIGATIGANYYGDVTEPGAAANGSADIDVGSHWLLDLEVRATVADNLGLALGVDNLLDEYPNEVPAALNPQAALGFSRYSPFGFNGRYIYGRVSYNW